MEFNRTIVHLFVGALVGVVSIKVLFNFSSFFGCDLICRRELVLAIFDGLFAGFLIWIGYSIAKREDRRIANEGNADSHNQIE